MNIPRKSFLKKFTKSSLVVAVIFAVNAFLLFFLEKQLEDNLKQYEGQIAFQNSLYLEKDRVSQLKNESLACKNNSRNGCSSYASNLLRYYNRLQDLIIVFKSDPFSLPNDDPLIVNLKDTKFALSTTFNSFFNLSLAKAISIGIKTPNQYGEYVMRELRTQKEPISSSLIDDTIEVLNRNIHNLNAWSQNKLFYLPKIEKRLFALQFLLKIIFFTQVIVYLSASGVDYWLNNIPSQNSSNIKRESFLNVFRTKRSKPLLLSIITGLITVVLSQRLLDLEVNRMISDNCRIINRNAITVNNISRPSINVIYSDLPVYCDQFFNSSTRQSLISLKRESNAETINSEQIRIFGDNFSSLEDQQLRSSRNLALFLIFGNVLTISLQLVKLDFENEEVD